MEKLCTKAIADHVSLQEDLLSELGIVAVVIGGSTAYDCVQDNNFPERDLDGAVVMDSIHRISDVLERHRPRLRTALKIFEEENTGMLWPSSDDRLWDTIDAIRYSGFSACGQKKSFKMISLEHFRGPNRHMNLLSFKDRRIYEGWTLDGRPAYRLQQVTSIHSGLVILHDPWLFAGTRNVFAFGVTADLLLTGIWLNGEKVVGTYIRNKLLCYTKTQVISSSRLLCFTRSHRFSPTFIECLRGRYNSSDMEFVVGEDLGTNEPVILYGIVPESESPHTVDARRKIRQIPPNIEFYDGLGKEPALRIVEHIKTPFASNSTCCILEATVCERDGTKLRMKLFSKASSIREQNSEHAGGLVAAQYFPLIQVPIFRGGKLLYPFFEGKSQAERQLQYRADYSSKTFESILDIEMRKSEDMLNAYRTSLQSASTSSSSPSHWSIHRFFHNRLSKFCRFEEFYGSGIDLDGRRIGFDELMQAPVEIDGIGYPCLSTVHKQADDQLHPTTLSTHPIIFGLGDAHGGNVLVRTTDSDQQELLYVDYESSGYHSALLDLAKQFYNDIFFDTLYADQLIQSHGTEISFHNGKVCLRTTRVERHLSNTILQIKRRFLIEPLFQFASQHGCDLHGGITALSSALFACALLTRNFANNHEAFAQNLCHALMLSRAGTLRELFDICEVLLGFEPSSK